MTFWSTFSLNENVWILIRISLKFVCKGPVNNIPALVQIMARRRRGNKPLSEPMMVRLPMHICVTRPQWLKIIQHWKSKMPLLNVTYIYIYIVIGTNHHQTQCIGEVNPSRDRNRDSDDPWWSHQMETFSALLAICAGNSPVPGEFPTQRPVTRSFDVFFDLRLNKRLSKQWRGWWFETQSCPLWRHRNANSGPDHWCYCPGWWPVTVPAKGLGDYKLYIYFFKGYERFWI